MDIKTITVNRKAYHDYHIEETIEAGLVLTGTEIKSIREGKINIRDAYAKAVGSEIWLMNAHIAQYRQGNRYNHEPTRDRKLLLHKKEIAKLSGDAGRKGLTMIPVKVYLKGGRAKVAIGLAKGKKIYDKRRSIADRESERKLDKVIKSHTH